MNQHTNPNESHPVTGGKRTARRWLIAAAIAGAVATTGFASASMAGERGMMGLHGHGMRHGPVDAATANKHIDRMVERIVGDGTAQQKARLAEIAKSCYADLQGTHAEFRAAHEKAHQLLMQPAIDRVALEQLRVEQIARMDKISKRMLTAVEDAAEVLTPEQRMRFAEHLKKRMH